MKKEISVCKGDVCLNAKGEYAEAIALAATFTVACIGVAAIVKALS